MPDQLSPSSEKIARRYAGIFGNRVPSRVDSADLLPVALLAAWKAEGKFDSTRGASLSTWVKGCVWRDLAEYVRKEDHLARYQRDQYGDELPPQYQTPLSLEVLALTRKGDADLDYAAELAVNAEVDRDGYTPSLRQTEALALVSQLRPKRRAVILLHYWQGMPLTHISKAVGWSENRARQICLDALREMREVAL